ncbi:YesL family protein [Alkalicoccus saliphilus]|uniref:DUF624 domain-containing protein n=1 Tax=Alkalicoccus saliphilus TaxID=200989 RepID=A0A2T4U9D5_9BACI|nr:DUF624 domain-containing protein [Alkalicoccus saliphilus]PTL40006.1 hypothetical protein C6Y45_03270 [Alkalicoccus saliphilus]
MLVRWMANPVYAACDWLVKLAYLNFLWVLFTLAGGIVFGFAPSTAALFTLLRKLVHGETLNEIFQNYASVYKKEFFRSGKYGLVFLAAGAVLTVNMLLLTQFSGTLLVVMMSGMIFTIFLFFITSAFFFPVYISMPELSFFRTAGAALFLPFSTPGTALLAAGGTLGVTMLLFLFPVLLTFWGITGPALIWSRAAEKALHTRKDFKTDETSIALSGK